MKHRLVAAFVLISTACAPATPVIAQAEKKASTDPQQAMLDYRTSPAYMQQFERFAAQFEQEAQPGCDGIHMHWNSAVAVPYGPLETWPQGGMRNATWIETVPGTACGHDRRYRMLLRENDGQGTIESLLPGDGFADSTLENDATKYATASAQAALQNRSCKAVVLNTDQVEKDYGKHPAGPWSEVWTVAACGKLLTMKFQFIPDKTPGTGATIAFDSASVKVVGNAP